MTTATTRRTLTSLKTTDLKRLAYVTGLNAGGTKAQLTTALANELIVARVADVSHAGTTRRLLSIDMGIRNLAYCVLDMPRGLGFLRTGEGEVYGDGREGNLEEKMSVLRHLRLTAWERVVVNELQSVESSRATEKGHEDHTTRPAPDTITKTASFEPIGYAKLAYQLVAHLLSTYKPTTIIIERQRWRSGGASSVLEWTIRVNMFEGMIHAALEAMGQQWKVRQLEGTQVVRAGRKESERSGDVLAEIKQFPDVYSVSPKRVFDFWDDRVRASQGPDGEGSDSGNNACVTKKAGSKTKAQKQLKINIVQDWLQENAQAQGNPQLECHGHAEQVRVAFLEKLNRTKGRANGKSKDVESATSKVIDATVEKLDDLADCLLQGVTWVQWEANRHDVLEEVDLRLEENGDGGKDDPQGSSEINKIATKKSTKRNTKKAATKATSEISG